VPKIRVLTCQLIKSASVETQDIPPGTKGKICCTCTLELIYTFLKIVSGGAGTLVFSNVQSLEAGPQYTMEPQPPCEVLGALNMTHDTFFPAWRERQTVLELCFHFINLPTTVGLLRTIQAHLPFATVTLFATKSDRIPGAPCTVHVHCELRTV
jgi:hypothetical protein